MFGKKRLYVSVVFLVVLCSAVFSYAESGRITAADVNVRATPSTEATVLTQVSLGESVEITKHENGWYFVVVDGKKGCIFGEYVSVKSSSGGGSSKIIADDVNLRDGPSTDYTVIKKCGSGTVVTILDYSGSFCKTKDSDGQVGWVHGDFVSGKTNKSSRGNEDSRTKSKKVEASAVKAPEKAKAPAVEAPATSTQAKSVGQQMVDYGKKFLGVKYSWGGMSPKGFDCSGFAGYVYAHFGININRVAADQAKQGTKVGMDQLIPGDLVFFDTNGKHNYINHVGIYVGGGKFIHASSGSRTHSVVISDLSDFYARAFMTAKRFVK